MKLIVTSIVGAVAGLLLFSPGEARATICGKLYFSATAYMQEDEYTVGDVYYGSVEKSRANTKDILELLAFLTATTFPSGSYIEVCPDGGVKVKLADAVLVDVTQYLSFSFDDTFEDLFHGRYNNVTFAEKSRIYFPIEMRLHAETEGLDLRLFGVAIEGFTASAAAEGQQRRSGSIKSTMVGKGTIDDGDALIQGKVSIKGHGLFDVDDM